MPNSLAISRVGCIAELGGTATYVLLPHALDRKLPNAPREWPWQWLFPATRTYRDTATGQVRPHH